MKIRNTIYLIVIISSISLLEGCSYKDYKVEIYNNTWNSILDEKLDNTTNNIKNTDTDTWKVTKTVLYNWIDNTKMWLKVSDGFSISIFADWLPGARDIIGPDARWNFILSRTSQWIITILDTTASNQIEKIDILKWLNNPHWLALDKDWLTLYYAETDKISKIRLYSDWNPEKIIDLPNWWRHYTRSILFGTDNKLYVSIWSTCDTCYEKDERIASIYRMNVDWKNFEKVASGLRNSVFMDINPANWDIWATEMWRDHLWDNLPPDEINIIKPWNDYWWPLCYGKNIHDNVFDKNKYIDNPCQDKVPSHIDLQAHSAPLGISFIPREWWPKDYRNDIFVAYHGSWNRSIPTGYKIIYIDIDDNWEEISRRDFVSGWLSDNGNVLWRPVDILNLDWWVSYITDDKKWVIYKVSSIK